MSTIKTVCIAGRLSPMGIHCTQPKVSEYGFNKKPAKYINNIFNRCKCQMVYTNMKGAMQYNTKGVTNDYVLCVRGYLHTRHCPTYTYA